VGEADIIGTGRIEAVINPMMAEIALGRCPSVLVKANGMVGAFIDAKPTPGASLIVEDDDPVLPLHDGIFGAGLHTGWLIAVFADVHTPYKIELTVREFRAISPNRQVLDPIGCIDRIVFLFAGDFTSLASPAGELFDNQCIFILHGFSPGIIKNYT